MSNRKRIFVWALISDDGVVEHSRQINPVPRSFSSLHGQMSIKNYLISRGVVHPVWYTECRSVLAKRQNFSWRQARKVSIEL